MRKIAVLFFFLSCTLHVSAQFGYNGYDSVCMEFTTLLNAFIQSPTNRTSNEEIFNKLDCLQNDLKLAQVDDEERRKLNCVNSDIEVVKEFMAPVANKYNSHLKESQLIRLQELFGQNLTKEKLNVKCPIDEVEFIEIRLSSLRICYFHNISKKKQYGIRIKFYAASGTTNNRGDYAAKNNEYTPVLNNAGTKYLKMISASIIERF